MADEFELAERDFALDDAFEVGDAVGLVDAFGLDDAVGLGLDDAFGLVDAVGLADGLGVGLDVAVDALATVGPNRYRRSNAHPTVEASQNRRRAADFNDLFISDPPPIGPLGPMPPQTPLNKRLCRIY